MTPVLIVDNWAQQGTFNIEPSRSAVFLPRTLALEALYLAGLPHVPFPEHGKCVDSCSKEPLLPGLIPTRSRFIRMDFDFTRVE